MSDFDQEPSEQDFWNQVNSVDTRERIEGLIGLADQAADASPKAKPEAITYAEQAVELAKELQDHFLLGQTNLALGRATYANKQYAQALAALEAAGDYVLESVDVTTLAHLENLKGHSLEELNQPQQAGAAFENAQRLFRSLDNRAQAGFNGLMSGNQIMDAGDPLKAIERYEEAAADFKSRDMLGEYGMAQDWMGFALFQLNLTEQASEKYATARKIYEFVKWPFAVDQLDLKQAKVYLREEKPAQALELLEAVTERFRSHSVWNATAECEVQMAVAFAQMGMFDRAQALLEGTRKVMGGLRMHRTMLRTEVFLAQLQWLQGNTLEAFEQYLRIFADQTRDGAEPEAALQIRVIHAIGRLGLLHGRNDTVVQLCKDYPAADLGATIEQQCNLLVIQAQAEVVAGRLPTALAIANDLVDRLKPGVNDLVLAEAYEVLYKVLLRQKKAVRSRDCLLKAIAIHNRLENFARSSELMDAVISPMPIGVSDFGPIEGCNLVHRPDLLTQVPERVKQKLAALWNVEEFDVTADLE